MKYKLYLDEENYLSGFAHTNTEQDTFEMNANLMNIDYLTCYQLVDGSLVWDENKYQTIKAEEQAKALEPTWEERIDAQVLYTALLTDSLLEE